VHLAIYQIEKDCDDSPVFRPPASPPLTGTLSLDLVEGIEHFTRGLLTLSNGIRFRDFVCTMRYEEDYRWVVALVERCSNTLEYVEIDRKGPILLLSRWC
jgi:hypothetical protein